MADFSFNISDDGPTRRNLQSDDDTVTISADDSVEQVRLTFTSSEVGNGDIRDSDTMANQDGDLAVRAQAERTSGAKFGPISRFEDEGITFEADDDFTFDVRDLVSGTFRGNQFDAVELGTSSDDSIDETGSSDAYYINGGMGDDSLTGGRENDFLVGGAGNDQLDGRAGDNSFIGGGGNDSIVGDVGDDLVIYNVATDGVDGVDLGTGLDTVNVAALAGAQVRLTFTSSEVGDGSVSDSDTMTNQDGGLAVRMQAEDDAGSRGGAISRFDDQGIVFASTTPGVTFDVRDLVSGTFRGNEFDVVELGTRGSDTFVESGEDEAYYINGGRGNDSIVGGLGDDFLVGGAGDDRLDGRRGSDSFIGGGGSDVFVFRADPEDDSILDFVSGTDQIDLRSYGIAFGDVQSTAAGADTLIDVDSDSDATFDFQITLVNAGAPVEADYLFA